jgi:non-heme chloroperoxidase
LAGDTPGTLQGESTSNFPSFPVHAHIGATAGLSKLHRITETWGKLGKHYVTAYDRRGHAGSDKPADGYDFDTLAADLAAVLDQLDLNDVTLVGHSMGAGEVARYLARHGRKRIARTLLVAPTTPFALKTADNPDGIDRAIYDKIVATLEADPPAYLAAGAPGFFGRGAEPEMVEWGLSIARQA